MAQRGKFHQEKDIYTAFFSLKILGGLINIPIGSNNCNFSLYIVGKCYNLGTNSFKMQKILPPNKVKEFFPEQLSFGTENWSKGEIL